MFSTLSRDLMHCQLLCTNSAYETGPVHLANWAPVHSAVSIFSAFRAPLLALLAF